jgi:Tfp pilus assembly protein PilF
MKKRAAAAINLGEAYMGGGNYTAALGELLKAEKVESKRPHPAQRPGLGIYGQGEV